MSKNYRKMIFIFCVGITLHLLWPFFQKSIEEPILFIAYLNMLFVPIITLYIFNARLNLTSTILITLCAVCLSPIFWMFVGFEVDIEFLYSTLFESYSILCITATLLLCLSAEELCTRHSKPKITTCIDSCTLCGNGLLERQLFCSNCHTISPKVKDTLDRFPHKVYLDFAEDITKHHILCPHCNEILRTKISPSIGWASLGIPLHFCVNCQNVHLCSNACEWFGLPLQKKIFICLFDGLHVVFYLLFLFMLMDGHISSKACLFLCLVITLLRIVWFFTITIFDIRESKARLNANPEYPIILIKMGYQHFTEGYSKFHNHK